MAPTRVLIVDDSATVRRMLSDILGADPEVEVVGVAGNGALALQKVEQLKPDVVTLDVEMPDMSGLEVLKKLRAQHATLPVIMFSSLTEKAGATTIEALARGATDCVAKPSGAATREDAAAHIRQQLLPKVKGLVGLARATLTTGAPLAPGSKPSPLTLTQRSNRPTILAIGSSTGGPNALTALLSAIAQPLRVPVVITQHMPPMFTRLLAERLGQTSGLRVREAADGEVVNAGEVVVAPGDRHMKVTLEGAVTRVQLDQGPPENSCRPAVDVMFRALAASHKGGVLSVVLTGMGQDGLIGSRAVVEAGGVVLAQDEASSVVWGMPGFVARAGLASAVLPISTLGAEVSRRLMGAQEARRHVA